MKYTPNQQEAIDHLDGNLQIIACAGSGKTQVISQRIVNILREKGQAGISPANIVAFTFTDKAAAELKDRIHRLAREQLGSQFLLAEMFVGTIHGFCLDMLQTYLFKYLKYSVLSEVQQRLLIDHIPREVMEKRAVECGDIRFFDLAYLEAEVQPSAEEKRTIQVELKNFVIPDTDLIPDEVRAKITKWSDYIDYWAVDWDFRHDTFMNQWQTYRTRIQRKLDLVSGSHRYKEPGVYHILIKVVDIFGNDTNRLLGWEVK
jgi:superfamily I DNA/RNA helicase